MGIDGARMGGTKETRVGHDLIVVADAVIHLALTCGKMGTDASDRGVLETKREEIIENNRLAMQISPKERGTRSEQRGRPCCQRGREEQPSSSQCRNCETYRFDSPNYKATIGIESLIMRQDE